MIINNAFSKGTGQKLIDNDKKKYTAAARTDSRTNTASVHIGVIN